MPLTLEHRIADIKHSVGEAVKDAEGAPDQEARLDAIETTLLADWIRVKMTRAISAEDFISDLEGRAKMPTEERGDG